MLRGTTKGTAVRTVKFSSRLIAGAISIVSMGVTTAAPDVEQIGQQ